MKKLCMILSLVLVLCFAFAYQQAEQVAEAPDVDIAAEKAAIQAAFEAHSKAGPTMDVEQLMKYVASDIHAVGQGGKDSVREWYTNMSAKGRYFDNGVIEKIEVSASGDMAYTVCTWEMFNDEGSTGNASNLVVWGKQADGTWKMVAW